ncbi:MAG: hypothetical protein ABIH01_05260, partial [Candidatus Omnitrophota bacterium]
AELRRLKNEAPREIVTRGFDDIFKNMRVSSIFSERVREADYLIQGRIAGLKGTEKDIKEILKRIPQKALKAAEALDKELLRTIGVPKPVIGYYYREEPRMAHMGTNRLVWNLYHYEKRLLELAALLSEEKFNTQDWEEWMYEHCETVAHESQHFELFEEPGKHTHHRDETVIAGFRMRMGEAIDTLLFDMPAPDEYFNNLYEEHKIQEAVETKQ